jgi:predicted ATPase with chaperone activity
MLARRLTTILPPMTLAEAIETTRIDRVAGLTGDRTALVTTRPFRAPHHTISDAGLRGLLGSDPPQGQPRPYPATAVLSRPVGATPCASTQHRLVKHIAPQTHG